MKTRTGFVSNSSSSSFVIGSKTPKVKIVVELDLEEFCEKSIKTKEELIEYYISEVDAYCCKNLSEYFEYKGKKEAYDKAFKEIEKGNVVYIIEASSENYDNPIERVLYDNGFTGLQVSSDVTIIEEKLN